jgi:hypothetical protein
MEEQDFSTVIELEDYIEHLFETCPDKRKKKLYKEWCEKINTYIIKCNKMANHPIYAKVKL